MINHARNLLINVDGNGFFPNYIAEEIIPDDYHAKTVPSYVSAVRKVLFGTNPDRSMLNYRCRQYLSLLHSCELEQYVLDLDPRITYDFDSASLLDNESLFDVTAKQITGVANQLAVTGEVTPPDRTGQLLYEWSVSYTSPTTAITLLNPIRGTTAAPVFTDGLSDRLSLPGSGLYIQHYDSAAAWQVTYLARPQFDLGSIVADLQSINSTALLELFGVGSDLGATEPFVTFRNLWNYHYALPYKLGGLLLALIYQTDRAV
jgi:hypothetical protein